jgi:hypothetical protein
VTNDRNVDLTFVGSYLNGSTGIGVVFILATPPYFFSLNFLTKALTSCAGISQESTHL